MDAKEVLKAIDAALSRYVGDERELMEVLAPIAEGWKMRLEELDDDDEAQRLK